MSRMRFVAWMAFGRRRMWSCQARAGWASLQVQLAAHRGPTDRGVSLTCRRHHFRGPAACGPGEHRVRLACGACRRLHQASRKLFDERPSWRSTAAVEHTAT